MFKLIVFVNILFSLNIFANVKENKNKKPSIILYEDGTWLKVNNEIEKNQNIEIEDTWSSFKLAIKNKDTVSILKCFDFPFEIDVCLNDESLKYRKLIGNYSKKKLIDNLYLIFDVKFVEAILKVNSDEYAKREKYNSFIFEFQNLKRIDLVYEIQFYKINDSFKIGFISIGYGK